MTENPGLGQPVSPTLNSKLYAGRLIAACQRCRTKKVRCDQSLPKCDKCTKAQVDCVSLEPFSGRLIPRSYVAHLESTIQALQRKVAFLEHSHPPAAISDHERPRKFLKSEPDPTPAFPVRSDAYPRINGNKTVTFLELMSSAVKVNRHTFDLAAKIRPVSLTPTPASLPASQIPAILPPKDTALQFLAVFFAQSNSQLPILHREEFLRKYFVPVYGLPSFDNLSLASDHSLINSSQIPPIAGVPWFDQYKIALHERIKAEPHRNITYLSETIVAPVTYKKCLFFLNYVFAIALTVNHLQYPADISAQFRAAAMVHYDMVIASSDPLESLEGVLLYALYALMRPTQPLVWYILGSALRMCADMDLHNDLSPTGNSDAFTTDRRRRLFWCTYSLDRQICFYLDRPVGIPDEFIKCPYPSSLDDADLIPGSTILTDGSDNLPSYKNVARAMFAVRQIQSQVQRTLYASNPVPSPIPIEDWKAHTVANLTAWRDTVPQTSYAMNCAFNTVFFRLNYAHTMLVLHNLSPQNYHLQVSDYIRVCELAKELIGCYVELQHTMSINYTWAAVHNLFLAGTSYLFAIYNSAEAKEANDVAEVRRVTSDCLLVFESLIGTCDSAANCHSIMINLVAATIHLRYGSPRETNFVSHKILTSQLKGTRLAPSLSNLVEGLESGKTQGMPSPQSPSLGNDPQLNAFFEELANPHSSSSLSPNAIIPMQPSESRDARRTFELMHQTTNGCIWDEFFSTVEF